MAADLSKLRGDYLEQVRTGSREEALRVVLEPLARGEIELATFYDDVLGPVAARVGDLWHAGGLTVAEEHYATAVNREARVRARALVRPTEPNGEQVLLACAPEEQHDLGLQMAADVLELAGYETTVLGMRTPARDLAAYAETLAPSAIVLSCSTPITVTGLIESVRLCRARGFRVVVGGSAVRDYPAVARAAGADATCSRTAEVVETLAALLSS